MNKEKPVYIVRNTGKEKDIIPIYPAVFFDSQKAHDYFCKLTTMFPSYHF